MSDFAQILSQYTREAERMPSQCPTGSVLNRLLGDASLRAHLPTLERLLIQAAGSSRCFDYPTCIACPQGVELAAQDLYTDSCVSVPSWVLAALCGPWQTERWQDGSRARQWPEQCPRGLGPVLTHLEEGLARMVAPECFQVATCLGCSSAIEEVELDLLSFLEEGWQGAVGQRLRPHSPLW